MIERTCSCLNPSLQYVYEVCGAYEEKPKGHTFVPLLNEALQQGS